MNNYQIYEEMGKGRHSTIYKGRKKKTIEYYAIASIDKSQRPRVLNSVQLLRSLSHKNIIEFHNWYETNNHLWVITELCTGGDLRSILQTEHKLPENSIRILAADIAEGLCYMHSKSVLYADLKPSNILLDSLGKLRFYDFDLSMLFSSVGNKGGGRVGTPSYMAPELFEEGGVTSIASDLWSFGCLLYEMVVGQPPFVGSDLKELIDNIMNKPFERVPGISDVFNALLDCLLTKDPVERGDWADVEASDFFPQLNLLGRNTGSSKSGDGSNNYVNLSREAFPPQPAFESFLKRLEAEKKAEVAAAAKVPTDCRTLKSHALRASINAERNWRSKLHRGTGDGNGKTDYTTSAGGSSRGGSPRSPYNDLSIQISGVKIDQEMDFRDPSVLESNEECLQDTSGRNTTEGESPTVTTPKKCINPSTVKPQISPAILPKVQVKIRQPEKATSQAPRPASSPSETNKVSCVEELAVHPQDAYLRPLVHNTRIERYTQLQYDSSIITVRQLTPQQLRDMPKGDVESYLTSVYTVLSCQDTVIVSLEVMYAVMCFFETLCCDSVVAEIVVNSELTDLFLSFFSTTTPPQANSKNDIAFRVQVATVLGLLVRHAENIQRTDHESFINRLMQALNVETSTRVRRRLLACLGELIFFIATRPVEERVLWKVDSAAVRECFLACLKDPDEAMTHYSAKIIENAVSLTPSTCPSVIRTTTKIFGISDKEFVISLLSKYDAVDSGNVKTEHLRIALSCAALKLSQTEGKELFGEVFEWTSFSPIVFFRDIIQESTNSGDVAGAGCKHNFKTIQAYLTCCIVFCGKWINATAVTGKREDVKRLMKNLKWTADISSKVSMTSGIFSTSEEDVSFFNSLRALSFVESILRYAPEALEKVLYECSFAPVRGKAVLLASLLCLLDNGLGTTEKGTSLTNKASSELPLLLNIFNGPISAQSSVLKLVLREKDTYVRTTLNFFVTVCQVYTMDILLFFQTSAAVKPGSSTPKWFKEQLQVVKYILGTPHPGKNPASDFLSVPFQLSSIILSIAKLLSMVSTKILHDHSSGDHIEIAQNVIQLVEIVQQEMSKAAATGIPVSKGTYPSSSVVTCTLESDAKLVVSTLFPALLPFVSVSTENIQDASHLTYLAIKCIRDLTIPIIDNPEIYDPSASSKNGLSIVNDLNAFMVEVGKKAPHLLAYGNDGGGGTTEGPSGMLPAIVLKLLSTVCERSPSVSKDISNNSMLDLLFPFLESKVISLHVVSLLLSLLKVGGDTLLEYAVTDHKLMQKAVRILQQCLPSWETMGTIVEPTVEVIYLIICLAVKNPTSQAARASGHLLTGADSTPLETSVFKVCINHTSSPASDCAASIIFMICQLFDEARKLMVTPRVLTQIREIINASCNNMGATGHSITSKALSLSQVGVTCENTTSAEGFFPNTAIPVFKALMIVAKLFPGKIHSDELLLVQIQHVSESCVHHQLKELANDLMILIFES